MRLACLSIALSPVLFLTTLPNDARGAGHTERAEIVWSSRDGLLRSDHSATANPDVEPTGEAPGQAVDTGPPTSQDTLTCEPFR
jgi:hypothetical protein